VSISIVTFLAHFGALTVARTSSIVLNSSQSLTSAVCRIIFLLRVTLVSTGQIQSSHCSLLAHLRTVEVTRRMDEISIFFTQTHTSSTTFTVSALSAAKPLAATGLIQDAHAEFMWLCTVT